MVPSKINKDGSPNNMHSFPTNEDMFIDEVKPYLRRVVIDSLIRADNDGVIPTRITRPTIIEGRFKGFATEVDGQGSIVPVAVYEYDDQELGL